jgi:hypothetical protein
VQARTGDLVGGLVEMGVVGSFVGRLVGGLVGNIVGGFDGGFVGNLVGAGVGGFVGGLVGSFVGNFVGAEVGGFVGGLLGRFVGSAVGRFVGGLVGNFVGGEVGRFVGALLGGFVGCVVGRFVGGLVGDFVGDDDPRQTVRNQPKSEAASSSTKTSTGHTSLGLLVLAVVGRRHLDVVARANFKPVRAKVNKAVPHHLDVVQYSAPTSEFHVNSVPSKSKPTAQPSVSALKQTSYVSAT